jgi:hypothetical protein
MAGILLDKGRGYSRIGRGLKREKGVKEVSLGGREWLVHQD